MIACLAGILLQLQWFTVSSGSSFKVALIYECWLCSSPPACTCQGPDPLIRRGEMLWYVYATGGKRNSGDFSESWGFAAQPLMRLNVRSALSQMCEVKERERERERKRCENEPLRSGFWISSEWKQKEWVELNCQNLQGGLSGATDGNNLCHVCGHGLVAGCSEFLIMNKRAWSMHSSRSERRLGAQVWYVLTPLLTLRPHGSTWQRLPLPLWVPGGPRWPLAINLVFLQTSEWWRVDFFRCVRARWRCAAERKYAKHSHS